jgi:hypothetical protein
LLHKQRFGIFSESFEGLTEPPLGWLIDNPDQDIAWELATFSGLIGINDQLTRAFYMDHFDYAERGEEDYLFMIPVDLTGVVSPALNFDLAHKGYDSNYSDGLRVEFFPGLRPGRYTGGAF